MHLLTRLYSMLLFFTVLLYVLVQSRDFHNAAGATYRTVLESIRDMDGLITVKPAY